MRGRERERMRAITTEIADHVEVSLKSADAALSKKRNTSRKQRATQHHGHTHTPTNADRDAHLHSSKGAQGESACVDREREHV